MSEWTQSNYCKDRTQDCTDDRERVIRGGSFQDTKADEIRTSYREHVQPTTRQPMIGFRCVANAQKAEGR